MNYRSAIIVGVGLAGALGGTATVVAHDGPDAPPPGAVVTEPRVASVDDLLTDKLTDAPNAPSPQPTFEVGRATVIPPESELGRKHNATGDPTVRLCRDPDGSIWVIHTTPLPGKDPYPDTPEDLRRRPC